MAEDGGQWTVKGGHWTESGSRRGGKSEIGNLKSKIPSGGDLHAVGEADDAGAVGGVLGGMGDLDDGNPVFPI